MSVIEAADVTPQRRVWTRRTPTGDVAVVLRSCARVLVRDWPMLFALSLAGLGARAALDWLAVRASRTGATPGLLIFILVPVATMVAMIGMLRVARRSLPFLSSLPVAAAGRARTLDAIGSVLLPFLAVYASYGYLQADRADYYYKVWFDNPTAPTGIPTKLGGVLLVAIVVAVALRWVLGHWAWAVRRQWLGFARAYLEIAWIAIAASILTPLYEAGQSWLEDRNVVHWVMSSTDQLRDIGGLTRVVINGLGDLLGAADTVIVVPIAWLALGAVVYGHHIEPESRLQRTLLVRKVARRWVRLPRWLRRLFGAAREELSTRFGDLIDGFRLLAFVGLAPMLIFCLLFVVVQTCGIWLTELERVLIGPRDIFAVWIPISAPLAVLNDAVQTVLLICLLAGATDRALSLQAARLAPTRSIPAPRPAPPSETPSEPVVAGTPEAPGANPPVLAETQEALPALQPPPN